MADVCSICNKQILGATESVICCKCSQPCHIVCANLTADDVAYLKEVKEYWICQGCSRGPGRQLRSNSASSSNSSKQRPNSTPVTSEQFSRLMSSIESIASDVSSIKSRQDSIFTELKKINLTLGEHARVIDEHSSAIDRCEAGLKDQLSTTAKCEIQLNQLSTAQDRITEQFRLIRDEWSKTQAETSSLGTINNSGSSAFGVYTGEALEKFKRSHNLIIGSLPESERDDQIVRTLLTAVDPMSSQFILSVGRIGSKNGSSGRPRLLKVMFGNIVTPKNILRNKSVLLSTEHRSVTIRDDMTPGETRFLNSLREQLKSRIAEGETNITIKYVKGAPAIVHLLSPRK